MPGLWLSKSGLWLVPAALSATLMLLLRHASAWTMLAVLVILLGLIVSIGVPHLFASPEDRRREMDDRLSDFE